MTLDGEAGDEIGVGRGQEADHVGLVDRFGDAAQRRAFDLLGLRALERFSQCGRMRSVSVMLGAMALTLMPSGPSSWASLRVKAMMPPLAAA